MMASSLVVCPLKSSDEYDWQFQLTAQAFGEKERTSAESVTADVLVALSLLFPPGHGWIARSDWF